jgi:phosphoglycolate phosphatase
MPKHIIWDWNGTLLDDVQACVSSINNMLIPRSLPTITIPEYREIFDFPVKSYYKNLGFDMKNENWDDMANEFHRHYADFSAKSKLRQDAAETLAALHANNTAMSILSACEITILERMLKNYGIRRYFTHVFGLDNLYATSKLDQGRILIKKLNLPPQDILLIGDTNHDHEVAEKLGIQCILLTGGHQSERRLANSNIIHSPRELPAVINR